VFTVISLLIIPTLAIYGSENGYAHTKKGVFLGSMIGNLGDSYTQCLFRYTGFSQTIKPHCQKGTISSLYQLGLSPFEDADSIYDGHAIDFCGDSKKYPAVSKCSRLVNAPLLNKDFNNSCKGKMSCELTSSNYILSYTEALTV
jgi:hypothetical protein